jgi:outer membrane protein assembly factor BamE (lipoprotein component of BamABCDE complex)
MAILALKKENRMISNTAFKCRLYGLMMFALVAIQGCTQSGQMIASDSIEDRIARLRVGETTKSDVEQILGLEHDTDRNRWSYNFSDSVYEVGERRYGPGMGVLPFNAGVVPTNTRAVVLMSFNDSGIVKHLEVARFFDDPFVNDYWYLVKKAGAEPLESIATLGESVGMKVVGMDKNAGTFTLEDVGTKAKIAVKLEGETMHLNSRNPHHRMAPEYRAFIKREYALTSGIVSSEVVQ